MRLVETRQHEELSANNDSSRSSEILKDMAAAFANAIEAINAVKPPDLANGTDFYDQVRHFEIDLIQRALKQTHGNQAQAARLLNLNQTTLHGKIKQYNIYPSVLIYNHDGPQAAKATSPIDVPKE